MTPIPFRCKTRGLAIGKVLRLACCASALAMLHLGCLAQSCPTPDWNGEWLSEEGWSARRDAAGQSGGVDAVKRLERMHDLLQMWVYVAYQSSAPLKIFLARPDVNFDLPAINAYVAIVVSMISNSEADKPARCVPDVLIRNLAIANYIGYHLSGQADHLKQSVAVIARLATKTDDLQNLFWTEFLTAASAIYLNEPTAPSRLERAAGTIWNGIVLRMDANFSESNSTAPVPAARTRKPACQPLINASKFSFADAQPYVNGALFSLIVDIGIIEKRLRVSDTLGAVVDMLTRRVVCGDVNGRLNVLLEQVSKAMAEESAEPMNLTQSVLLLDARNHTQAAAAKVTQSPPDYRGGGAELDRYLYASVEAQSATRTLKGRARVDRERLYALTSVLDPIVRPKGSSTGYVKHGAESASSEFANVGQAYPAALRSAIGTFERLATLQLGVPQAGGDSGFTGSSGGDRERDHARVSGELLLEITESAEIAAAYFRHASPQDLPPAKSLFIREALLTDFVNFFYRTARPSSALYSQPATVLTFARLAGELAKIKHERWKYSDSSKVRTDFMEYGLMSISANPFDFRFLNWFSRELRTVGGMEPHNTRVLALLAAHERAWAGVSRSAEGLTQLVQYFALLEPVYEALPNAGVCPLTEVDLDALARGTSQARQAPGKSSVKTAKASAQQSTPKPAAAVAVEDAECKPLFQVARQLIEIQRSFETTHSKRPAVYVTLRQNFLEFAIPSR